MSNRPKSLVRWLLVAAAALAMVILYRVLRDDAALAEVVVVSRGPLAVTIDEEGKTEVHDRFVVASPITGRLSRISLIAGDSVEEGTPLAEVRVQPLDPRAREEAQARVEGAIDASRAAAAGVASAKAALDQARRDLARNEHLAAGNAISAQLLEQSRLTVQSQEEQVKRAEADHERANHEVDAARSALIAAGPGGGRPMLVRAPVSGRVLRVFQPSERVVLVGAPLVEIGNPRYLDVVVEMLSEDAVRIQRGDTMLVTGWGGTPRSLPASSASSRPASPRCLP